MIAFACEQAHLKALMKDISRTASRSSFRLVRAHTYKLRYEARDEWVYVSRRISVCVWVRESKREWVNGFGRFAERFIPKYSQTALTAMLQTIDACSSFVFLRLFWRRHILCIVFLCIYLLKMGSCGIFLGDKRSMPCSLPTQNLVLRCLEVFEFHLWFFGSFCFKSFPILICTLLSSLQSGIEVFSSPVQTLQTVELHISHISKNLTYQKRSHSPSVLRNGMNVLTALFFLRST